MKKEADQAGFNLQHKFPKSKTSYNLKGPNCKSGKENCRSGAAVTLLAAWDVGHGGGPPPPPSSAGAGAMPAVPCAYPPLPVAVPLYPDPTPPPNSY